MKKILVSCLLISLLVACSGNAKNSNKDSVKKPDTVRTKSYNKAELELIKRFGAIFRGIWVRTDYIDSLKDSHSPYKSRSEMRGVSSMYLHLPGDGVDSTHISYSLNNHEGADFILYLKSGNMPNSLKVGLEDYEIKSNFYELGYLISNKDTSVKIYHLNKNNKILNTTSYTKVADKDNGKSDAGWGIDYITNKILISGKYLAIDSTGGVAKVGFDNEESCTGFLDFKTFSINTDFEAGPANDMDEIIFDVYTKKQKVYLYNFKSDSIFFYDENYNADSTKQMRGKLRYKLVRQR